MGDSGAGAAADDEEDDSSCKGGARGAPVAEATPVCTAVNGL